MHNTQTMVGVQAQTSITPSSTEPSYSADLASISGMVDTQNVPTTETLSANVSEDENLAVTTRTITISKLPLGGSSSSVVRASVRQRSSRAISVAHRNQGDRPTVIVERKRSIASHPNHSNYEERTGFARIYFENQKFTSSTVLKLTSTTTVIELRRSMAQKMKISASDFIFYVIVMVYPSENARSVSARTLHDTERVLPLLDRLNRVRASVVDENDSLGALRAKPKHRSRQPVKFVLKDVRGAPLDLENEHVKNEAQDGVGSGLTIPAFLGTGVRSGYLQKASEKDLNVWRKRWFVLKDDQLLYCKTSTNQRDVTTISLLNAYLAKARAEVCVPFSFELRTPHRIFELCASSKEDMVSWIQALHIQIGISSENHRLYEAEIIITEDAVARSDDQLQTSSPLVEPSLLQRVLLREDARKLFRDFACSVGAQPLVDAWIECENFRRNCLDRQLTTPVRGLKRSAREEWDQLKTILRATEGLSRYCAAEVAQLRQSFQSEQINRRLSIALDTDVNAEYPRVELIAPLHQTLFQAIENGPFNQFLICHGYRLLLERILGRII